MYIVVIVDGFFERQIVYWIPAKKKKNDVALYATSLILVMWLASHVGNIK
jgi:hypothetical protein